MMSSFRKILAEEGLTSKEAGPNDLASLIRKVQNLRRKLDGATSPFDVHDIASERNQLEWEFERKLPRELLDEALTPIDYPALEEARLRVEKPRLASAEVIEVGDIIEALTKRGWTTGTIAEIVYKPRAGSPYEIRYVTDDGQDFRGKRRSNRYDDPANQKLMKFKGKSRAKKIIQESIQRKEDILQRKKDRADAGSASLESWNLRKGDIILYKYNNMTRQEIVAGVNYSTGKVGIERYRNESLREDYLRRLKDRREHKEMMEVFYGMSARGTRDTSVRWLPGTGVVQVVQRIAEGG